MRRSETALIACWQSSADGPLRLSTKESRRQRPGQCTVYLLIRETSFFPRLVLGWIGADLCK